MINDISVCYPFRFNPIHKQAVNQFCSENPKASTYYSPHQKMDSWVIVVNSSSAFIPLTELPLLFRRGLHTATE